MRIPFFGKKPPAIADPAAHARLRYGKNFRVVRTSGAWEKYETFRCTRDFEGMDGGYRRHCGPTAMVNLLETLENRDRSGDRSVRKAPQAAFRQIAAIGLKKHYYINADLLGGLFGGTFNPVLRTYLRASLARFHRAGVRVMRAKPAWRRFLADAADRGSLLYLVLVFHPLYGNHHVIGYGTTLLEAPDGTRKLYVRVADGWNAAPHYLAADDLRFCQFLEITPDR